ncbi:hypothetical protein [Streptomyces sp. AN091965]|uniref:hypothetical protein n=1 Tax=Streptomyces sp. AN091965 TaxID=2927803 RepID=UPI001F607F7F|nr:hypothetical protein [Streptomyces sp. AN091965]MCI3932339.1 hypothetical protein [Streptomyces sp. AN091965]
MDIWQPEPGETLLTRAYVAFATGDATPVSGMRWFRDTERNDIQHELPGWPEGPLYTANSPGRSLGRNAAKVGLKALYVTVVGALTSQGGSVGPAPHARSSADRADEVDDFPVMWAAPGSVARTLPWQLDPGRTSERHYRTHAVVTDRRLVIVGLQHYKKDHSVIEDEILWEVERPRIHHVELRDYKQASDIKVTFTDDSWCRLRALNRAKLARYLAHPFTLITPDHLTPELRGATETFIATARVPGLRDPVVTRRPCGHYLIEALVPGELNSTFGAGSITHSVNADGTDPRPGELHPEDL